MKYLRVPQGNHQSDSINHRLAGTQVDNALTHTAIFSTIVFRCSQAKVVELRQASDKRRARLHDSSQYLQFTWKADLVESWISEWDRQSVDCPT